MHIETDVCEPCGVLGVLRPTNKMGVNFPTHYTSKEDVQRDAPINPVFACCGFSLPSVLCCCGGELIVALI